MGAGMDEEAVGDITMYRILFFINRLLIRAGYEIRKKVTWPYYYLQRFAMPGMDNEAGVFTIPVGKIVSPHGFSYGPQGWHYYTEFLRQYEADPAIRYETSVLKRYYDAFRPQTVGDIFLYDRPEPRNGVFDELPALLVRDFWRLDGSAEEARSHLLEEETQLYGPISDIYGEEQFIRCINAHRLIKKHGYVPERFEDGYLGGFFLKSGDDYRFIVFAGKHRLAALSVLGYKEVKVTCPYNLKILDIDAIDTWPTIRSGLFSAEDLLPVFMKYFEEDGWRFAAYYQCRLEDCASSRHVSGLKG